MAQSPYAPPKAEVTDVLPKQPASWGRAAWLHLPIFVGLLVITFIEREVLASGLAGWGVLAGLVLTAVLLYFPTRALRNLSDAAPPWWTDVLYYSSVAVFIGGLLLEDSNVIVAGGTPTVLLNGILGVMALVTEKRRRVRVYISGRRYLFSADRAL